MRRRAIINKKPAAGGVPVAAAYIEAESAEVMGARWSVQSDPLARGGQYIVAGLPKQFVDPPTNSPEMMCAWPVLLEAGVYILYARVNSPSSGSNSTYFKVNDSVWVSMNDTQYNLGAWHWREVTGLVINVEEGLHTIYIHMREDGQPFDQLYITKLGDSPI